MKTLLTLNFSVTDYPAAIFRKIALMCVILSRNILCLVYLNIYRGFMLSRKYISRGKTGKNYDIHLTNKRKYTRLCNKAMAVQQWSLLVNFSHILVINKIYLRIKSSLPFNFIQKIRLKLNFVHSCRIHRGV